MNNNNSFENRLAATLAAPEPKAIQIHQAVLSHCVEVGFITKEEQQANSERYLWLIEVVERNILSLSLLEQIILDVSEPSCPAEVRTEVDAKAAAIINDIAKRIMKSAPEYPSPSKDSNTKAKKN